MRWRCGFCAGAGAAGDGAVELFVLEVERVVELFMDGRVCAHVAGLGETGHCGLQIDVVSTKSLLEIRQY